MHQRSPCRAWHVLVFPYVETAKYLPFNPWLIDVEKIIINIIIII